MFNLKLHCHSDEYATLVTKVKQINERTSSKNTVPHYIIAVPLYGDKTWVNAAKITRIYYNAAMFNTQQINVYDLVTGAP